MRPRRSRLPLLFAAILVPCAALAALGIHALATEASQTEQRYRQRAEGALDEAVAAVEATAEGLPRSVEGALRFSTDASGELVDVGGRGETRPTTRPDDGTVVDLLLSVLTEVEALERAGDLERASARLGDFLESNPSPDLAAAALTALAAVEKKRGKPELAKAAWGRIVSEHPDARDARGLKRAFAARLALLDMGPPDPRDHLALLYHDLVYDDDDPSRPGTGALKRAVRSALGRQLPDHAEKLLDVTLLFGALEMPDARDRTLAVERQLRAALVGDAGEWIRKGGRGNRTVTVSGETRAAIDGSNEPVRVVLSARELPDGRVSGGIAPLDAVISAALSRREIKALESVGFSIGIQSGPGKGPVPPRSAGDALGGVMLGVIGADLDAFRRSERTRFVMTASLAGLGLLVAALAAIATTRAVTREQRAVRDRESARASSPP
jgi:hypothetical protein